jgi:hypothetical protein
MKTFRYLRVHRFLCVFLTWVLLHHPAQAETNSSQASARQFLIDELKVSMGSVRRTIAGVLLTGTVVVGDEPGKFSLIEDREKGFSRLETESGGFREVSGYDVQPWIQKNGALRYGEKPFTLDILRGRAALTLRLCPSQ